MNMVKMQERIKADSSNQRNNKKYCALKNFNDI